MIVPSLLGWDVHQGDDWFLAFLVATHLATAVVLFLFFLRDWLRIARGLGRSLRDRRLDPADADARPGPLLAADDAGVAQELSCAQPDRVHHRLACPTHVPSPWRESPSHVTPL